MVYEIAGLRIAVENEYPYTDKFCASYLSIDQTAPADITAKVTQTELEEEKERSEGFSIGYIENICLYRAICRQLPSRNRFLLHCSVLDYDGKGVRSRG